MASDFYERKRRLAYLFGVLSVGMLFVQLSLGALLEVYSRPRVSVGAAGIYVAHRSTAWGDESPGSRLVVLDPELRPRQAPVRLLGSAAALLPESEGLTAYFSNRYSVIRDGNTVRNADLNQLWEVRDGVYDASKDQAWLFGWAEGNLVYRRRVGAWSATTPVATSAILERLCAAMDPAEAGPLVAWREEASTKIRTALFEGDAFRARDEFDLGAVEHWTALRHGGRTVLIYYHRDDRSFQKVGLRLKCCAGCGKPPLPESVVLGDPLLLVGRRITGIAAAAAGERLVLALTRAMSLQVAALSLADFRPEPGSTALRPVGSEPLWRTMISFFSPVMMLFFSFSLVFLGFTMLRERGRFVLEMLTPKKQDGPPVADILQRAMAYILDLILLLPMFFVLVEVLSLSPETGPFEFGEPRVWTLWLCWLGFHVLYGFLLEWTTGRTIGKRIIGIRAVRADGSKLGFAAALIRNLIRPFDASFPLGQFLGASVIAATPRRQRLGDLAARTIVVQDPRGQPPPEPDAAAKAAGRATSPRRGP